MKFNSLRTSLVGGALALIAAALLGSCGGGGASGTNEGGNLRVFPQSGTFFAGVPATVTIVGGRRPYIVSSSEPGILPVPQTVDASSFTVIPNQPGVIDTGIEEGQLPIRSVVLNVTDQENGFQSATIRVAQNFLTGYGFTFSSNCAPPQGTTNNPGACAGGETAIRIEANFNGTLAGNRTYRLEVTRGPFFWVYPDGQIAGNTITVTTDHEGKAFAIFRVSPGIGTQIGAFRIVDVETGVSVEHIFPIQGIPIADELEIIPDEFTFTGPNNVTCGTGSAQFLVFDGVPPYTATSSFGQVTVTPTSTDSQPGQFRFSVNDPNVCLTDATIVVTDARLARGTVTITTDVGDADPPPLPVRVVPSTMTVACGQSGSAVITGGTGTYSAVESDPFLTTAIAGNTITVTDTRGTTTVDPTPVNVTVTVTDGSSTTSLRVTRSTDCI